VLALSTLAGVDRGAFSPLIAGTTAWVLAAGGQPSPSEVSRLAATHFGQHISSEYVTRFEAIKPEYLARSPAPQADRDQLLAQAFLESKSALRRLILATSAVGSFPDDEHFEANPLYGRAVSAIDSLELELTALDQYDLGRCPKCWLVGEVNTWFGHRRIRGREINQSWCRICRTNR
jgi:hypothetical protein